MTLQQVADQAGVSLATASRSLNGSNRAVKPEHSARVLRAAQELGYVSHGPAQALAKSRTSVVGLIVHEVDDPYFAAIASGAMRVAARHDLLTILANTFHDPQREIDYVRRFQAQRVRALVLTGSSTVGTQPAEELANALRGFEAGGGRVAFISDHGLPYPSVLPANTRGGGLVAQHLHDLGHRDVGVIAGPATLTTVRHRLQGFSDRWAELGGQLPPERIVECDFDRGGGYSAALELLARRSELTAIFGLNDLMAMGAMAAVHTELGRRIPDDISVVGFDDLWMTNDLRTPLTTVRLPLEDMGAQAMALVLDERGGGRANERIHVPAELVSRMSSGPVRAGARRRRAPA